MLYNFFTKKSIPFTITSYEEVSDVYNRAQNVWKNTKNVKIINDFFTEKETIKDLLIPNTSFQ